MTIFIIIAAAIVVVLLCREAILHKGDFFERGISERREREVPYDLNFGANPPAAVDGTLPGDPLYPIMHPEDYE